MFRASQVLSADFQSLNLDQLHSAITENYSVDESSYLEELLALAEPSNEALKIITANAVALVEKVRASDAAQEGVEAFLQQYNLGTKEGVILMCLAEALLRIPDADVANSLIKDKIKAAEWDRHLGKSRSRLVNASTWGLMLTGRLISVPKDIDDTPSSMITQLMSKVSEPVIRQSMNQAMKLMGRQFVLGRNISEALKRAEKSVERGYTHSFDMLGEAAYTQADAERYFNSYMKAIESIGSVNRKDGSLPPSISIKLSALHPRYEHNKHERVMTEMVATVNKLAERAKSLGVALTIDAEEADRLEISLDVFEAIYTSRLCQDWDGFGLVVQAYSKRALPVLVWLDKLAQENGRRIPLRLVKGAYWDSEIKWAQKAGLDGYPVFTRKVATDVSYLACARYIFSTHGSFYPQFATHNAQTVCNIIHLAGTRRDFEFQRLHGMGEALYDILLKQYPDMKCRIYAPVGEHKDLLPYLVRRLLENGANTSFVHRLVDETTAPEALVEHPAVTLRRFSSLANEQIPLPENLYGPQRKNSHGVNLHVNSQVQPFLAKVRNHLDDQIVGGPIINGRVITDNAQPISSPYDASIEVGKCADATEAQAEEALASALKNQIKWNRRGAEYRAQCLNRAADLFESRMEEYIALCAREAGKSLQDGIDEVRETVDFCRYYANRAILDFGSPIRLPGPTGESNELTLHGRGVFSCISPWNFPLAIFIGQVAAALAAGNAVLCKPAGQTPLVAFKAILLMHEAGIPTEVLHFVPGGGSTIGKFLTSDPRIAGVAFTGSTQTAWRINRALAARENAPIVPLIAETGGQNAMLVDSSALPEQVVSDVVHSAFTSAGQRCSALRVLYIQEEVAPRMLEVLKGAMAELTVGDPADLATDVGPVIDAAAKKELEAHIADLKAQDRLLMQTPLPGNLPEGHFVAPTAFKIDKISDLKQEFFGPILHVITYKAKDLDRVLDDINGYGYGLTLGIHSRNESTAKYITAKAKVGNIYINRDMIGAVVGVQPFGGLGLSGTGPKAGGPHYLLRFATEQTTTNNTAAIGGNATLLSLGDGLRH